MIRLLTLPFELIYRTIQILIRLLLRTLRPISKFLTYLVSHAAKLLAHSLRGLFRLIEKLVRGILEISRKLSNVIFKVVEEILKLPLDASKLVTKFVLGVLKFIYQVTTRTVLTVRTVVVLGFSRSGKGLVAVGKLIGRSVVAIVKAPLHLLLRVALVLRRMLVALNLVDDIVLLPTLPFLRIQRKKRR